LDNSTMQATTLALAVTLLVMVVVNVWVHLGRRSAQTVVGPLVAASLLGVGRVAGLSWEELGLGRDALARGLWSGLVVTAVIAATYAIGVTIPVTRRFFRDTRYRVGPGSAFYLAFVAVPFGTVVVEEVAFRGVVWSLIEVDHGPFWATFVSSILFGLWHVLPAIDLARTNQALESKTAGRHGLLVVLGTVAFTTLAGVVFGELRHLTGSLVAPVLMHWATNGLGVLAAARVWAISRD
jgi:uncharacterized protein